MTDPKTWQELHVPKHKNPSFCLVSKKKNIPSFWGKIYILITSKHSEFFGQTKAARMSATNTKPWEQDPAGIKKLYKSLANHLGSMLFALKLHDGTAKIAKKRPKKRKSERKNENVTTLNKVRFATTEVEECEWTTECSKHCSLLSLVMPAWFERRKEYSPITSWWCPIISISMVSFLHSLN